MSFCLSICSSVCREKKALIITFEPPETGFSYYKWVFLVAKTFCLHHQFWPPDLDLDTDYPPSFTTLTLSRTFQLNGIEHSCYTWPFIVAKPFYWWQKFCLDFWPTFEKILNIGHIFSTKRDRTSISHNVIFFREVLSAYIKMCDPTIRSWCFTFLLLENINLGHNFMKKKKW